MASVISDSASDFLFDVLIDVGGPWDLRSAGNEGRLIYQANGGRFEGPKLKGEILPVTGDWVSIKGDVAIIDARLKLRTEDGEIIVVNCKGERPLEPELIRTMERRERADIETYRVHVTATFETDAAPLQWLTGVTAVGAGWRTCRGMEFRFMVVEEPGLELCHGAEGEAGGETGPL